MSHAFTIVPNAPIEEVVSCVVRVASLQPKIVVTTEPNAVCLYFAADLEVARRALVHGFRGLACVRICPRSRTIHVDTEGYDASTEQLEVFVRWVLDEFGPCRVFDDETGEDLGAVEARELFEPEEEFLDSTGA